MVVKQKTSIFPIKKLWNNIPLKAKIYLTYCLLFGILTALLESAILILLNSALSNQNNIFLDSLKINAANLGLLLAIFTIFLKTKGNQLNHSTAAFIGSDLSIKCAKRFIISENFVTPAAIVSVVTLQIRGIVAQVIRPIILLITNIFILLAICLTLYLSIGPKILFPGFSIALIYIFISSIANKKLKVISQKIEIGAKACVEEIETIIELQKVIKCYPSIKVENILKDFRDKDKNFRKVNSYFQDISVIPRNIVEGILLSSIFIFIITNQNKESFDIALVGSLAVASLRILPLMQGSYMALTSIKAYKEPLNELIKIIEYKKNFKIKKIKSIKDKNQIKKIKFNIKSCNYFKNKKSIESEINFGEIIAIRGISGVGKTTILDSFLSIFYNESSMELIYKNGEKYRLNAQEQVYFSSYMPQKSFLFSEINPEMNITLKNNQKFINRFNELKLVKNIIQNKYKESRYLSGGEKQRIAFVRSLQKDALFLLLDEPTSGQDNDRVNEMKEILKSAKSYYAMIVIVSHDSRLDNIIDRELFI